MKTACEYVLEEAQSVEDNPDAHGKAKNAGKQAAKFTVQFAKQIDHKPNLSWEPTGGWEAAFQKILSMLTSQSDLAVNGPLTSQGRLQAFESSTLNSLHNA
jgi:hypothetical protein